MKTRKRGHQLFNDNPRGRPRTYKTGYGSANKARRTLKKIHKKPKSYQRQVATTMYYRAKYHKYQTEGMRNAMKIYGKFLNRMKQKGGFYLDNWVNRSSPAYINLIELRSKPLSADIL